MPFQCPGCGMRLTTADKLSDEEEEKRFRTCPICGSEDMDFSKSTSLYAECLDCGCVFNCYDEILVDWDMSFFNEALAEAVKEAINR